MGTAFSRGTSDHLSPMLVEDAIFGHATETQADVLRQEVQVDEVVDDGSVWADCEEKGLVMIGCPADGRMMRIRVSGQAVLYRNTEGVLVMDSRVQ
jgi:hypothetical protein